MGSMGCAVGGEGGEVEHSGGEFGGDNEAVAASWGRNIGERPGVRLNPKGASAITYHHSGNCLLPPKI